VEDIIGASVPKRFRIHPRAEGTLSRLAIERAKAAGIDHRLRSESDRHRAAVQDVEARWASAIGRKRFEDFKETLTQLIALDGNLPD